MALALGLCKVAAPRARKLFEEARAIRDRAQNDNECDYEGALTDIRHRRENARELYSRTVSVACAHPDDAVIYDGWYGSIHTLFFHSEHYARLFMQENPTKVL